MVRTDLRVTIDADSAKLEREMQRAARSMAVLDREISKANRTAAQLERQMNIRTADALQHVGRGMVLFGAATAAGLGLAAKAAIDWESAWAGVRKTVEGTPEQLAEVEAGLRDLATELPATHQQIAAVAEAAGQLGIATPDIVEFTRVMINLGETTNLTAEEAATSIAQLMNVMQTAPQDVGRLGAALVELGNNGASTERDIIQMAQRIAGAGQTIGLSEADVLGLANALASVGIEAEAGGTAISTAMIKMASAVESGGDELAGFADVAGMSAQQFARAFEQDPARAIQAFVAGLGRINAAGGNVFATLDDLGLGSIRTRDAILRLAGAGDLLGTSLDDGARAWADNTALVEEAAKRYETAEAKIAIARNTLVDLAIDVGNVLLPAISGLAEGAADLLRWFGDLPGPVKTVLTLFATLLGTVTLLGGGFLLLAPKIAAARVELAALNATLPAAATAMKLFTLSVPVVGVLLAVAAGIAAIASASKDAGPPISEATRALLQLADGVSTKLIADTVALAASMQRLQEMAKESIVPEGVIAATDELNRVTGEFERNIGAMDTALADMVASGNADAAKAGFEAIAAALAEQGFTVDEVRALMPGYSQALQDAAIQSDLAAGSAGGLAGELSAQAAAAEAAEDALKSYLDELKAAVDPVFAVINGLETVTTAQDAYNTAVDEHGAKSAEARAAAVDLAEAIADLEQDVSDGDLSWSEFDATLARWVEQGVLTEGQADAIRDSAVGARKAAEDYEGDYAAELKLERNKAAERAAKAELDRIAKARTARVMPNLDGRRAGAVERGISNLARNRSATIYVGYAVSGSGLPVGLRTGHSGGLVTGAGIIPRLHSGANLAGLRGDELPAILQTGERVLSRSQNAVFTQLSGLLTRWQDAGIAGRTAPAGGAVVHNHFHNHGVIGSRAELERWFAESHNRLGRTGRLNS